MVLAVLRRGPAAAWVFPLSATEVQRGLIVHAPPDFIVEVDGGLAAVGPAVVLQYVVLEEAGDGGAVSGGCRVALFLLPVRPNHLHTKYVKCVVRLISFLLHLGH